jgi:hypothetical protein
MNEENRSVSPRAVPSSVNPDRLVLKQIVLNEYPFKIHKKSAVIRFMLFLNSGLFLLLYYAHDRVEEDISKRITW